MKAYENHNLPGVPCPACGWHESTVTDSRPNVASVRRRRRCVACEHVYGTVEVVLPADGVVIRPGVGMTQPVVTPLLEWLELVRERATDAVRAALR